MLRHSGPDSEVPAIYMWYLAGEGGAGKICVREHPSSFLGMRGIMGGGEGNVQFRRTTGMVSLDHLLGGLPPSGS